MKPYPALPYAQARLLTEEGRVAAFPGHRRAALSVRLIRGLVVLGAVGALAAVPSHDARAVQYPGFTTMVTDSMAAFSIPSTYRPLYLMKVKDPTFNTGITRVSGVPGTPVVGLGGNWGTIVRHVYPKVQPWNSSMQLLALDNDGSSTPFILANGATYQPMLGDCNGYPRYDWRWHPLASHRNEQINVNSAGTELMWYDVTTCTKTRSWPLPIVANYGIGSGEGNTTQDGRYVVIANDSQMVVVDMDPKDPYPPYPNLRVGPVYSIPACSLDVAQPLAGKIGNVGISPSGRYIDLKYAGLARVGFVSCDTLCDMHRIFQVEEDLSIQVHNMAGNSLRCGSFAARPNGWIYPLKHADMAFDPSDNNEEILIGGRACPGSTLGHVVKVRLSDGRVTSLTSPVNEPAYLHGSARNILRPGWFYVTYAGDAQYAGDRFHGEVVAVKTDGSGQVQRFAHYHSTQAIYESQVQAVPSPDGKRVLINSDWCQYSLSPCLAPVQVQSYVVDARPNVLLDAPETPPVPRQLLLSPPSPNPSHAGLIVKLALPSGRPAALEVFDVTGRRVAAHNVGVLGAGEHVVDLDAERRLPTGVYLITLTDGHASRSTKAVLLR